MSASHYYRLMALAGSETVILFSFNIMLCGGFLVDPNRLMGLQSASWATVWNHQGAPLKVWKNWTYVHVYFSRVWLYPATLLPTQYKRAVVLGSFNLLGALCNFAFFGIGKEPLEANKRTAKWL